jgi:hypothetical protein
METIHTVKSSEDRVESTFVWQIADFSQSAAAVSSHNLNPNVLMMQPCACSKPDPRDGALRV